MAFNLSSLFFGNSNQAAAAPAAQQQPQQMSQQGQGQGQQQQVNGNPGQAGATPQLSDANNPTNFQQGNSATQSIQQQQNNQQATLSPIDQLSQLLNNKGTQNKLPDPDEFFKENPEAFQRIVDGLDLNGGIDQEVMQRFQNGDQQATMQVMQAMIKNAISQSLNVSRHLVKAGTEYMGDRLSNSLPQQVMKQNVANSIMEASPYAAPFANMIVDGLSKSNPNSTPQQLQQQAQSIVQAFADSIVQHQQAQNQASAQKSANQADSQGNQQGPQDFMKILGLSQ